LSLSFFLFFLYSHICMQCNMHDHD
jgi:hypothetical protein